MSLESGVDGEAAGSGIHAGHILHVVDLFEGQFGTIIPVVVVQVLWERNDNFLTYFDCITTLYHGTSAKVVPIICLVYTSDIHASTCECCL